MRIIINKASRSIFMGTAAVLTLSLAACAGAGSTDQGTVSASAPGSATATPSTTSAATGEAVETDAAVPRLAISHEQGVEVFDASPAGISAVAGLDVETSPNLVVAPDDRHVFVIESDQNRTQVLDVGSYSQPHGDHFHHYLREPALRPDVIEGDTPVHVVNHGGRTAIFNDGDGIVNLFDIADITAGGLQFDTVIATSAHHGVAVPLQDSTIVTQRSGEEGLPESLVEIDAAGEMVNEWKDACPGLHGEATTESVIAFGCADSVLLLNDGESTNLDYPEEDGDARVGSLYAASESSILIGNYSDARIASIDAENNTFTTFDVSQTYGPIVRGADEEVILLGTDGILRGFDATNGEPTGQVQAIDAFDLPDGHGTATPGLALVGTVAYLTDPMGKTLTSIDTDAWAVEDVMDLDISPTHVVAVNTGAHTEH